MHDPMMPQAYWGVFAGTCSKWRRRSSLLAGFFVESLARGVICGIDLWAFVRYRKRGLAKYSLLAVNPKEVEWGYGAGGAPPAFIGTVNSSFWAHPRLPAMEARNGTLRICGAKVRTGLSWEACGEKARLEGLWAGRGGALDFETFWSHKAAQLDQLERDLRSDRLLRTRRRVEAGRHFRERNGIGIMLGPAGEVVVGAGHHRLGLALALELPTIPVCLVGVHPDFVRTGWEEWRRRHQYNGR
jgi:hypothetical protein